MVGPPQKETWERASVQLGSQSSTTRKEPQHSQYVLAIVTSFPGGYRGTAGDRVSQFDHSAAGYHIHAYIHMVQIIGRILMIPLVCCVCT